MEDYFIVPVEGASFSYIYFPLKAAFFRCDTKLVKDVDNYFQNGKCNNIVLQEKRVP